MIEEILAGAEKHSELSSDYYATLIKRAFHAGKQVAAPADLPRDKTTLGRIKVGERVTSEIDRRLDRDWFRCDLKEGKTYLISVKGVATKDGTLADPWVGIYDNGKAYGKPVLRALDDNTGYVTNAELTYTAKYTGDHYIECREGGAKYTGTYTLELELV